MNKDDEIFQVTKSFLPPMNEYIEEIKSIWENHWLTNNGEKHIKLEQSLERNLKVDNVALCNNGHLALDIAIKSLELKGEVITTPFTFASTTHAIVLNGLKPVFCDVKMEDFTIDEEKIEELITKNTVAIIPVQVFGYPCNVEKIDEIAKKYDLKVIYDAAHAFGVEVDGKGIGSFGDISIFSFHATKVFNTIEGGALTTNNKDLKRRFDLLKNFGITGQESVEAVGLNAKMNEFQAAMGIVNLKYIDQEIDKRRQITEVYRQELSKIEGITYLEDEKNVKHNYAYFPIVVDEKITGIDRNELHEKLKEYNIFTRKYFYPLVTDFDCYKGKYNDSNLKNAKYVADRIITLPMHGELSRDNASKIIKAIEEIIESKNM